MSHARIWRGVIAQFFVGGLIAYLTAALVMGFVAEIIQITGLHTKTTEAIVALIFLISGPVYGCISAAREYRDCVREQNKQRGFCMECGYDLRESRHRCPECGTPIGARADKKV